MAKQMLAASGDVAWAFAAALRSSPAARRLRTLDPFDDLLGEERTERELRKAAEAARSEADQVGLTLINSSIAAWEPQET